MITIITVGWGISERGSWSSWVKLGSDWKKVWSFDINMKNKKVVELDGLPVEEWKVLGC